MGGGDASPVRCQSPIENGISPTTTMSRRDRCEADTGIGMNGRVRSVDSLDQGNNSSYTLSQLRTVSFSLRYICSKEEVDSFRYMTLNITSFVQKVWTARLKHMTSGLKRPTVRAKERPII